MHLPQFSSLLRYVVHNGYIAATCQTCRHKEYWTTGSLSQLFKAKGWSQDWDEVPKHLTCEKCGAAEPRIKWHDGRHGMMKEAGATRI